MEASPPVPKSEPTRRRLDPAGLALFITASTTAVLSLLLIEQGAHALVLAPSIIVATIGATHLTKVEVLRPSTDIAPPNGSTAAPVNAATRTARPKPPLCFHVADKKHWFSPWRTGSWTPSARAAADTAEYLLGERGYKRVRIMLKPTPNGWTW